MTLFSYILAYDSGSAPNPFFRYCTLCICKPRIRSRAKEGDWIIATGPSRHHTHRKLVYAMQVSEVLPLADYFRDPRFKNKKPNLKSKNWRRHVGDNLYQKISAHQWQQLSGPHQPHDQPKDLSGKNALIATRFYYFGTNAIPLPPRFQELIHTNQGHRSNFRHFRVLQFIQWLQRHHTPGIHGKPTDFQPVNQTPCNPPTRPAC